MAEKEQAMRSHENSMDLASLSLRPNIESPPPSPTGSAVSESSTVEWNHVPFTDFQAQVLELGLEILNDSTRSSIEIERLRGGGENRVIGLKLTKPATFQQPSVVDNYVLRIPRRICDADFPHTMAQLDFAARVSSIPVPKTIKVECSKENPIQSPYLLQERIPGQSLLDAWPDFNLSQKLSVTRQIATLFQSIRAFPVSRGGIPDPKKELLPWPHQPPILRYPQCNSSGESLTGPASTALFQSPTDMLQSRLDVWMERDIKHRKPLWEMLSQGFKNLNATTGLFESEFYWYHGDFQPRNLLVAVISEEEVKITGVLDWDNSHFAPAVVAFEPPCWLWMQDYWKDASDPTPDGTEWYMTEAMLCEKAGLIPTNDDDKQIKECFEEYLQSPYVLKFAYANHAVDARRLYKMVLDGLTDQDVGEVAVKICERH
ncbi:hypothetical protein BT63DRAFT_429434 [Microthyrium microscopicum]|uniref:Aminoglycoside phosphotransferase domain-containing protein n=1 Tax=Microthyrium microscopicum TaxID=703497 RepID=A0A6A6TX83_9PEZI|nr:hypothetical protein BT63DRAFT_429434 [Microthyrium microscopicum]